MAANVNPNPSPDNNVRPVLQPEIGPDGLPRESPVIAYTEKIIEEEQLQLQKYIQENYSKIRDVERELANLSMEMKLTSGPKKAALEHMRKKIEMSNDRLRVAKQKEEQARKAWEEASKAVKDEEAFKQKLCEDLNNLVQESSNTQLARLEELKRRLEAINPSRPSTSVPVDGNQMAHSPSKTTQDAALGTGNVELASEPTGQVSSQGNARHAPITNGNQGPDSEGRGRKKTVTQGRAKGIEAVPKGRGSAAPGWTGAGFDVDGRS
ncbi:hypothetical protein ACH5RR_017050 [Cinchona calisaya]|uniref:RAB6-interacting golgin n=1 Tax=Cinchona calisaya TaxID=153742 RepID=A0ABD2ZZS3_9GENT